MYSTENHDSHLKWRNTWFGLENKIESQVILVQTWTKCVVRKWSDQVLWSFNVTPFLMNESCQPHTDLWRRRHVTHKYESCHMQWVKSHIWMSHFIHMNESCHTYEWVMSHAMSHVTLMNESSQTHTGLWRSRHVFATCSRCPSGDIIQDTAIHCNILQHTHCSTL